MKKYKKPNIFTYSIFRGICKILSKVKFNLKVKTNELKGVKGPYVLLASHESSIDFINLCTAINTRAHFVISNSFYQTLGIRKLMDSVGVIPKQQFQTSVSDMKKFKQVLENNMPLIIYPAGLMSSDGIATHIPSATGKVMKWLNYDVYIATTHGSYFTNPKWGNSFRKGKIYLEIKKLYSKDDLNRLSENEIHNTIVSSLYYDAYQNQEKDKIYFKKGDNISGLENVLYYCPKCHNEFTNIVEENVLKCTCCGNKAIADKYGFLNKSSDEDIIYKYPSSWSKKILQNLKNEILNNEKYYIEDECEIHMIDYKKHKFTLRGNGKIKLDKEAFTLQGTIDGDEVNRIFFRKKFPILPYKPGKYFEIQDGKDIYRIYLNTSLHTSKWINVLQTFYQIENN